MNENEEWRVWRSLLHGSRGWRVGRWVNLSCGSDTNQNPTLQSTFGVVVREQMNSQNSHCPFLVTWHIHVGFVTLVQVGALLSFKIVPSVLWIFLAIAVFYFICNLGIGLCGTVTWNQNLNTFVAEQLFTQVPYLTVHYSLSFWYRKWHDWVNAYHTGQVH